MITNLFPLFPSIISNGRVEVSKGKERMCGIKLNENYSNTSLSQLTNYTKMLAIQRYFFSFSSLFFFLALQLGVILFSPRSTTQLSRRIGFDWWKWYFYMAIIIVVKMMRTMKLLLRVILCFSSQHLPN